MSGKLRDFSGDFCKNNEMPGKVDKYKCN